MNTRFFLTAVATVSAFAVLSFVFVPIYIALYTALLKEKAKIQLDFIKDATVLGNKSALDIAIEHMFEEGVTE